MLPALFGVSPSHLGIVCGERTGLYEFTADSNALNFLLSVVGDPGFDRRGDAARQAKLLEEFEVALEEFGLAVEDLRGDPVELEPPLIGLVAVGRSADLRGRCVLAGRDALWLPSAADPSVSRRLASLWVAQLQPALRLRIYASLQSGDRGSFVAFGDDPPQAFVTALLDGGLGNSSFLAFRFEDGVAKIAGEAGRSGAGDGCLAISRVVPEEDVVIGRKRLFSVGRWGACSNLRGQSLAAVGSPYDFSTGLGWSRGEAEVRAEGEATERFALGNLNESSLTWATTSELPGFWLDPRSIAAHTEEQRSRLGLVEFDPRSTEAWWIDGQQRDGSIAAAPAALVFMPFPQPPWLHPGFQTTSGTAAHTVAPVAAQSAWQELVERDALLRAWWRGEPLQRVVPPASEGALVEWLESKGLSVRLLLLPGSFGIDAVGAFAMGEVQVLVGAAAGDLQPAAAKALMEVVSQLRSPAATEAPDPASVRSPADHAALWTRADAGERLRWLAAERDDPLSLAAREAVTPPWQTIKECPDPRAVFISLPLLHETDFTVVRALSPELVPLSFGYDSEPRAHPRLADLAWPEEPPWPHPFA